MRIIAYTALCLLLVACAAPTATKQYLLSPPVSSDSAARDAFPALGLREIALPLYARRQEIAVMEPDGAIISTSGHVWADDPARASTRLIARRLSDAGQGDVYVEPWPLGAGPKIIVAIEVDRFVGTLGGDTVLEGQMTLSNLEDRAAPLRRPFAIRQAAAGSGYGDLAQSYSAALTQLADLIGESAATFGRGG